MRAAKVEVSLRIRAVSPEPSLLAHISSEDTNSLDGALIKYFDKIKCNANRPYLVFSELKPEMCIYFFFA